LSLKSDNADLYKKIDRVLVSIIKTVSYISAVCLVIIMLIAFFNVIGEKLAKAGVSWMKGIPMAAELIQYFHIPVVFLAAGYVTLDRGHTRIDMLSSRFSAPVQKVLLSIGHALGAGISLFISYRAFFVLTVRFYSCSSRIAAISGAWPRWPFALIHGLGFFLLGISFLWAIVRQYAAPRENKNQTHLPQHPQECERSS